MRIGTSTAINHDLVDLFPSGSVPERHARELRDFMAEYLIHVVKFCTSVVKHTQKSFLSQLASSFTVSFDKEFASFEKDLGHWTDRINAKVRLLTTKAVLDSQNAMGKLVTATEFRKHLNQERRIQLRKRLSPQQDEFESKWRRERKKGDVLWVFEESAFVSWRNTRHSSTLWLTGHLGSGKSVVMANIVANLFLSRESLASSSGDRVIIASLFCQAEARGGSIMRNIIGSLVYQFVAAVESGQDGESRELWDADVTDPESAAKLAVMILPLEYQYFVVIDGLEEYPRQDVEQLFGTLKMWLEGGMRLKICCSSRPEAQILRLARSHIAINFHLSMSNTKRVQEINEFIDTEISRRRASRSISGPLRQLVQDALVAGAQGMYLWVVLQMESLFPEYQDTIMSDADVVDMIAGLPADLDEAYARALRRIPDRRYGSKIFEITAAASRPLTTHELRVALNVQVGNREWDQMKLAPDGEIVVERSAGGLLEVDEETDTVHYIHHSAFQFLSTSRQRHPRALLDPNDDVFLIEPARAERTLGDICTTYLSYDVHERRIVLRKTLMMNTDETATKIANSVLPEDSTARALYTYFSSFDKRATPRHSVDIARVIRERLSSQIRGEDVLLFLDYATNNWLKHTMQLTPNHTTYELFRGLVLGEATHIGKPWPSFSLEAITSWSLVQGHVGALCVNLDSGDLLEIPKPGLTRILMTILRQDESIEISIPALIQALQYARSSGDTEDSIADEILQPLPPFTSSASSFHSSPLVTESSDASSFSQTRTLASSVDTSGPGSSLLLVQLLIRNGADPNGLDEERRPLLIALQRDNMDLLRLLVEHKANVNLEGLHQGTPYPALGLAVELENTAAVIYLLANGADPNKVYKSNRWGITCPLISAVRSATPASLELIGLLLRHDAIPDIQLANAGLETSPLGFAMELDESTAAHLLLEFNASPSTKYSCPITRKPLNPIIRAVQRNWLPTVRKLTTARDKQDWDPVDGQTALGSALSQFAIGTSDLQLIDVLLEAGAPTNTRYRDLANPWAPWALPLDAAARCGSVDLVRLLFRHGAQHDAYMDLWSRYGANPPHPPILVAAMNEHSDAALAILEGWPAPSKEADQDGEQFQQRQLVLTNVLDRELGRETRNLQLICGLLEGGANLNACSPPALVHALLNKDLALLELLLTRGVDETRRCVEDVHRNGMVGRKAERPTDIAHRYQLEEYLDLATVRAMLARDREGQLERDAKSGDTSQVGPRGPSIDYLSGTEEKEGTGDVGTG